MSVRRFKTGHHLAFNSTQTPSLQKQIESSDVLALLGVDEVRELDGVTDEEDRSVVSDHVVVSFLSVELDAVIIRRSTG